LSGGKLVFVLQDDCRRPAVHIAASSPKIISIVLTQSASARLLRPNRLDDSAGRDALLATPGYCRGAPFSGSAQTGTRSKIIQLSAIFPNRARLSIF
jgi:hypothetical protein